LSEGNVGAAVKLLGLLLGLGVCSRP